MAALQLKSPPLSLATYTSRALLTDRFGEEADGLMQLGFGLFGEIGGLLAASKKASRDTLLESAALIAGEEIGDALWYLVVLAHHGKASPDQLGQAVMVNLRRRLHEAPRSSKGTVAFEELDGLVDHHHTKHAPKLEVQLRSIASSAGVITLMTQAEYARQSSTKVAASLGDLLAQLTLVARSFNLSLASIARENLEKIEARWPTGKRVYTPLYDEVGYEEREKLPRGNFRVDFFPRKVGGRDMVVQQWNGVNIGDPLTDNREPPDGYRYHDVFHLAYMAHLGWSPVLRALLKLKRKSVSAIDENQDGARALIIEEGIATWIFNHAKERGDNFANVQPGRLDFSLLKQVQSMVKGYEVDTCPPWQWELAILDGFKVFRELSSNGQGSVIVNIEKHTIKFVKATKKKGAAA
jgi:NTP pyrophosphatase (non-canonical NTP hydrolase)